MSNTAFATPSAAISALNLSAEEERNELESFIWDWYKTINGIRPRWMRFSEWSLEELREEVDSLGAEYMAQQAREKEIEKERVRVANEKAKQKRKFQKEFNSLASAWPA